MYLAKAFRKPQRKYKKRASGFNKAVSTIAKRVVLNEAETKTGWFQQNSSFGANGLLQSVWSSVTVGTGQQNREGDEIRSLGVRLRGYIQQVPGVITSEQDMVGIRMIVASGKRPLTSGDFPTYNGAIDSEIFNIVQDRYIQFSTTKRCQWLNKYIKFNRKVLFQGAAVNKNELYLFLVPFGGGGLTTTTGCQVNLGYQLYWKDI